MERSLLSERTKEMSKIKLAHVTVTERLNECEMLVLQSKTESKENQVKVARWDAMFGSTDLYGVENDLMSNVRI